MFPNLFHIALTEEGFISFSVRSNENRSDQYFFTKEDILPALDDDPTDGEWSGSEVFSMKRQPNKGAVRIYSQGHTVQWLVGRQEIEILNAQLKALCEEATVGLERPETVVIHSDFKKVTNRDMLSSNEMLREIRTIIREELNKCILALEAPSVLRKMDEEKQSKQKTIIKPQETFIPSHLADGLEGTMSIQGSEHKSLNALEAAKKLKEIKK